MLELSIEQLTAEIQCLRETIETQNSLLASLRDHRPTRPSEPLLPPEKPRFMNEREVAELVNMSVAGLRKWRLAGQGPPYYKVGHLVRYSGEDVMRWMDKRYSGR